MTNNHFGTSEKLMIAAIDLISERGYNGVTTLEIAAAAGFSEKTLFRHFGSKQNLLEQAFDRFHYGEEMKGLFKEKLVWDLHEDLLMISQTYHTIMNRNRKMIQIAIKEGKNLPGFRERTHRHPQQLKEFLTTYFSEMIKKRKMIDVHPEHTAVSFMLLNFGAFINELDSDKKRFTNVSLEEFITNSVQVFTRGLTP
ncbi:TetR/AcrR family transcriptional regulator [Halalkalibacterium halodurans]|uniref:TetR/AcrR family transcriptional regulator n=1 Tax=Halalkalibacterium halodurans TaxID=86665 RepID=UPI002E207ABF|nr:TetR/AcrR family transcriptional regulator [Halalkalibacterium halodurans]